MRTLLIGLMALAACAQREPPSTFSIDPEFSELESEAIRDAVSSWSEKTTWAPTEVTWSERGRFQLVDELDAECDPEPGEECEVAALNTSDNVLVKRTSWIRESSNTFWVLMAHETGHYCAKHTKNGIMRIDHSSDETYQLAIDNESVDAWNDGCN